MAQPAIADHTSELQTILKTVYGEGVQQQQNLEPMLYKEFSASPVKFGGNKYEVPARMVNGQSVGARSKRVALPEPIGNTDVTSSVYHKFIYGTFDVCGTDIERGKGSVNSFVNVQTDKVESITAAVLKDMNWQSFLNGTGVRAQAIASSPWSTGVCTVLTKLGIKYVRVGMAINVLSDADPTVKRAGGSNDSGDSDSTRHFITAVAGGAAPTITVAATSGGSAATPTSSDASDYFVRHKSAGIELTGLGAIVDDGVNDTAALTLQGISRATYPLWKAKVLGNSGTARPLTLQLMQLAVDIPEILSGKKIDYVIGSYNARDAYLNLLVPEKRYTTLKLDGGSTALEYNGIPFRVDVDCPDGDIFFLHKASIQKFGLFDLKVVEQNGSMLGHASLAAGDVFYGFLRAICNFGTNQSNANAKITDLSLDTNYIVAG